MENQFRYALNNSKAVRDSAAKWSKLNQLPRIIETLGTEEIADTTILKPGKLAQTYDLAFRGYLYVIYKDKYVVTRSDLLRSLTGGGLARFKEAKDYQIAAFSMKTPGQPITFSNKGIQLSDGKFFYEGTWGDSRVADILPFDYVP